jgi:L-alanine-DL-glutamate epimerase-like enolase superfamily enzyme
MSGSPAIDSIAVVQADVARIGGITPWLKTAHLAESFNVAVCPHFLMELHVALTCAVAGGRWVEHIPQLEAIVTEPMRIDEGKALPSERPGLGLEWDWQAIEAMRAQGVTHVIR